eukprot:1581731-Rhodomonas_salina.1
MRELGGVYAAYSAAFVLNPFITEGACAPTAVLVPDIAQYGTVELAQYGLAQYGPVLARTGQCYLSTRQSQRSLLYAISVPDMLCAVAAAYAMSGTEISYGACCLCVCYAMSGTDIANGAPRRYYARPALSGTCYAMSSTGTAHATLAAYALAMRCLVLPWRVLLSAYTLAVRYAGRVCRYLPAWMRVCCSPTRSSAYLPTRVLRSVQYWPTAYLPTRVLRGVSY